GVYVYLRHRLPDDPPVALAIALARAANDLRRQRGRGRLLVPAALHQKVAHVLRVEGRGCAPWAIDIGVPVPRGVGGEELIDDDELAVVETELEFRVREDEAFARSVVVREAVQLERQALEVAGEVGADQAGELRARDVLVVSALRLGRGREDRLGELLRFEEGPRERFAGDGTERLVLGPRGTRDVPACHALDVDPLAVLHEHGTAGERAHLAKRLRKAPQVRRDDVV